MSVRIFIVDDHEVVRMGLRAAVGLRHDWEICGEASDGHDALAKLNELSPDVVILDLSLPGLNGFETAMEIRRAVPFTKIILFSVHEVPATPRAAGADAFVSKMAGIRPLLAWIDCLTNQPKQVSTPQTRNTSA